MDSIFICGGDERDGFENSGRRLRKSFCGAKKIGLAVMGWKSALKKNQP